MRTPAQNKAIWSLAGKLAALTGLPADEIKALHCQDLTGQPSSSKLSEKQATQLIARLREAVKNAGRKAAVPDAQALITPEQQALIARLGTANGMDTPAKCSAFSRRQCGKAWPQTRADGTKIIEGLAAMYRRKHKPADMAMYLQAYWSKLSKWEQGFLADVRRKLEGRRGIKPGALVKLIEIHSKVVVKKGESENA